MPSLRGPRQRSNALHVICLSALAAYQQDLKSYQNADARVLTPRNSDLIGLGLCVPQVVPMYSQS